MTKNTEDKFSFRAGSGAAATWRSAEQVIGAQEIAPMRLAAGLLSDQKYQKYGSQIKSMALRSKVSKAEDYELNLFF